MEVAALVVVIEEGGCIHIEISVTLKRSVFLMFLPSVCVCRSDAASEEQGPGEGEEERWAEGRLQERQRQVRGEEG